MRAASPSSKPEKNMIPPCAVDLEVAARIALALEAVALENGDRRRVVGDAGRLDAVQPQLREREIDDRRDRAGHASLAGVRRAHPVAERTRLRDAAPDAAERDAAQQLVRGLVEDEERVRLVARDILVLAAQAAAEGGLRQVVVGPGRLPGLEKYAAARPEPRPGRIVRAPWPDADKARRRASSGSGLTDRVRPKSAIKLPCSASAILAWPGTLPTAPIAAIVGDDLSMAAAVLRTSSTEIASTRATISSIESGRP